MSKPKLDLGTILSHPCPECGGKMALKDSRYGLFYGCTRWPWCESTHGAHRSSGEPLGVPVDKETKGWRIRAHDAFDRLWKDGSVRRKKCYADLAEFMGIKKKQCHIGSFDISQCQKVIEFSISFCGEVDDEI